MPRQAKRKVLKSHCLGNDWIGPFGVAETRSLAGFPCEISYLTLELNPTTQNEKTKDKWPSQLFLTKLGRVTFFC